MADAVDGAWNGVTKGPDWKVARWTRGQGNRNKTPDIIVQQTQTKAWGQVKEVTVTGGSPSFVDSGGTSLTATGMGVKGAATGGGEVVQSCVGEGEKGNGLEKSD